MRVKALRLNEAFAMETEASRAAVFRGLLVDGLLCSSWSSEEEEFAVSEDSINIEEKKFDFFCTRLAVWHARILTERKASDRRCPNKFGMTSELIPPACLKFRLSLPIYFPAMQAVIGFNEQSS